MDDKDVSDDRPADGGAVEELSVGDWYDEPGSRHRWRRRLGFGLALCLVFVLGAAGAYGWMQQRQRDQPRIAATLAETQQSQARQGRVPVGIQLHSHGKHTVTLEKVRLSRSGFTVSSGGLDDAEKLSPQDSTEISYKLSPDCDTSVHGPGPYVSGFGHPTVRDTGSPTPSRRRRPM